VSRTPGRELDLLLRGELANPHGLLGKHPTPAGVVVRAWRPGAESVHCLSNGHLVGKLDRIDPAGLFEATLDSDPAFYQLEVSYGDGNTFRLEDPYRFPPTLGELDLHLIQEGRHRRLHHKLGAHVQEVEKVVGTSFAVWAPGARSVRVVGDFNSWDGRMHPMRSMGSSGVWELFLPQIADGAHYKFELLTEDRSLILKADPFAFRTEIPPGTSSIVFEPHHDFSDGDWMSQRRSFDVLSSPLSIYEVHLGSWRRTPDGGTLTYKDMAPLLAGYCSEMGFTHVELLPVAEYPFGGSWGYQVGNYFAPTARYGSPDEFRFLVDSLHQEGIGVIVDWVPAHFPRDEWALARFDGSALYEHLDPRQGEHPDWGTLIFNYGRNEVRNFLISNALQWIEDYHIDGLRVDAVASMLYLDYSRKEGEWLPNRYGGRENLEAIDFIKELNTVVHGEHPGVMMIAEESTAWPGVSRPVHLGGLGFGLKWNMGWMHDTLSYFTKEPIHRRYHHGELTFSLIYAFSENFVLPLSHDEVVHGKGSLLHKMPGDRWQQLANLRSLYAYMWAHPGKQLLFMGSEFAQPTEWSHDKSIDWHLLDHPEHEGIQRLVKDLNRAYKDIPALWERDSTDEGFEWIDANDADNNVLSFFRAGNSAKSLVCICNLSPTVREGFRIGLPHAASFTEVLNTDSEAYGGTNVGNMGAVVAEARPWHGLDHSAIVTLPPLGVLWLYG
jgi:1,4-alpha-glucan branching enzyme